MQHKIRNTLALVALRGDRWRRMLPRKTRLDLVWLEVAPDLGLRLTPGDIRRNSKSDDGRSAVVDRADQ